MILDQPIASLPKSIKSYFVGLVKLIDKLLLAIDTSPFYDFEIILNNDLIKNTKPELLAKIVRQAWKMPKYWVKDLTSYLERAGVFILDFDIEEVKELSLGTSLNKNNNKVIFLKRELNGYLYRWQLARQFGFVCFYNAIHPNELKKPRLNRLLDEFALHLLLGEKELTLLKRCKKTESFFEYCQHLKVPAAIINKVMFVSKLLSDHKYVKFQHQLKELKERKLLKEKRSLLKQIIDFHLTNLQYSTQEMAKLLNMQVIEFEAYYTRLKNQSNIITIA